MEALKLTVECQSRWILKLRNVGQGGYREDIIGQSVEVHANRSIVPQLASGCILFAGLLPAEIAFAGTDIEA